MTHTKRPTVMLTSHMIIHSSKFSPHWPHRNPNYHTCSNDALSTSFNFDPSSVSFSPSDPYLQPPPQSFLHSSQTNITTPLKNLPPNPVWLLKRVISCSSSFCFWTKTLYCLLFTFIHFLPLSLSSLLNLLSWIDYSIPIYLPLTSKTHLQILPIAPTARITQIP